MSTEDINELHRESISLLSEGNAAAALPLIDRMLESADSTRPTSAPIWINRGMALHVLGRRADAVQSFKHAIAIDSNAWLAYYNLGRVHVELGEMQKAQDAFLRSLQLNPNYAFAWNNLGLTLDHHYEFDAALRSFDHAIKLDPGYTDAYLHKASLFLHTHHLDEAELLLRSVILRNESIGKAHFYLAIVLLSRGNLTEGFQEFEWRWQAGDELIVPREQTSPDWDGLQFSESTLLLYAEQGLGDTLQFVRYLPIILSLGGSVILEVQPELKRLIEASFSSPALTVAEIGDTLPSYDYQLPLLSLPDRLGTPLGVYADVPPYLHAQRDASSWWKERLDKASGGKLKIGIAWRGSARNPNDHNRSMSWKTFEPIVDAAQDRAQFFSLQKGEICPDDRVLDHTREFDDFAATAAYVQNLDLVIAVDTSIVHLAGAMGKLTWTLISYISDWRWVMCESRSKWYPTMELFWQRRPGDWSAPIDEIIRELSKLDSYPANQ